MRRAARRVTAAALLAAALTAAVRVPVPAVAQSAPTLVIRTSPVLPGATFTLGSQSVTAGPDGTARMSPASWIGLRAKMKVTPPPERARTRARWAERWYGLPEFGHTPRRDYVVTAAFDIDYRVSMSFVDLEGNPVDHGKVSSVELKDATGVIHRFTGEQLRRPVWLWGTRVVSLQSGPFAKPIYYTVQSVLVGGANVVNQAQQRSEPNKDAVLKVQLLFYSATFVGRDAVFGFPVGSAVRLRYPDGQHSRHPFDARHEAVVGSLPRGEYDATIEGPGLPVSAPVSITRPQRLTLKIVTWLDLAVVMAVAGAFLGGLPLLRRRLQRTEGEDDNEAEGDLEAEDLEERV